MQADIIGASLSGLFLFALVGQYKHAHLLARAVRQCRRASHHLVGMTRINPEPQIDIDRFVEFRAACLANQGTGIFEREGASCLFDNLGRLLVTFSFFRHPNM